MRPGLAWLAALGIMPLLGLGVGFARPFAVLPTVCRFVLAGGAGAFVLSTLMTLAALVGLRWNPIALGAASVLASALIGRALSKGRPIATVPAEPMGPAGRVAAAISAGAVAVAALSVLAGASTCGDLILFWGPKGEAFAAVGTIDPAFLGHPWLAYMHPSYPPLVTNLFAFASMLAGHFSWGAATATFPLLLAGLALALPGLLRLLLPRGSAHATAAVVVCGVALLGTEADLAGGADMPLLFFETLAMALLVAPAARDPAIQVLAGLLLGAAVSAKVEGLPFALAAAVLFAAAGTRISGLGRVLLRLLGPAALATAAWFAFGLRTGTFRGYRGYGSFLKLYPSALGEALGAIGHALWLIGYGLPFLVPLLLLALRPRPLRPAWLPVGTAVLLSGFLLFTYLHVPDPGEWIGWSAARVYSPLVPLLALGAAAGPAEDDPEAKLRSL